MECKDHGSDRTPADGLVLIETLWNVKKYVIWENVRNVTVLIETLWNVKYSIVPSGKTYSLF